MNKAAEKKTKKTKTTKKPIKNRNYFARACRFFARLLLFMSILSFIGTASVLAYRCFNHFDTIEVTPAAAPTHSNVYYPTNPDQATAVAISIIVNIVIIGAAIVGIIYLALKYNSYARNLIDWIADKTKFPIHFIELGIPALFWSLTILMLIFIFPIVTLPLIFTFILNEFLFIIAWLAYGSPNYVY